MSHHGVLHPGLSAGLFALALIGASAASAQSVPSAVPTPTAISSLAPSPTPSGDSTLGSPAARRSAPAGFQSISTEPRALTMRQDESMGVGRDVAMMGVGIAGVITGLIIGGSGGTALAVGGGVIGLWGLYKFLQ